MVPQPKCGSIVGSDVVRVETLAVVADHQNQNVVFDAQPDLGAGSQGVLAGVGQRFLNDAQQLQSRLGSQRQAFTFRLDHELDREVTELAELTDVFSKPSGQIVTFLSGHLQAENGFANVDKQTAGGLFELKQVPVGRFRLVMQKHEPHGHGLGVDVTEKLGQTVVQFTGDALPFFDDGPLPQFGPLLRSWMWCSSSLAMLLNALARSPSSSFGPEG